MNKKILIISCVGFLTSCASLRDAGKEYFRDGKKYAGVQTPQEVIERTESNTKIRRIIYGSLTEDKIIACTLLRNQIYVASLVSLNKKDKQELQQASDILEQGYQLDDQAFLSACAQVKNSKLGDLFRGIQKYYFEGL